MELLASVGPYLGYVAGGLTVVSFIPQVVRVWRTQETHDLSLGTFVLLVLSGILWLAYGLAQTDWPVIGTNAALVLLNGALLAAKLRHG